MPLEGGQRVTNLVRDHRGHLAQRSQTALMLEPFGQLLALSDQHCEKDGAAHQGGQCKETDEKRAPSVGVNQVGLQRLELDEDSRRFRRRTQPHRVRW